MRLLLMMSAVLFATPAVAQRTLDVPAKNVWQHADTGLQLQPRLAGLQRIQIQDTSKSELDIMAQYGSADDVLLTVFLFRPALDSVPVWFDRAEVQVMHRGIFGKAMPEGAPLAFAPPSSTTASGLRRMYRPEKAFMSTGLAVMPLGEWLVAVRLSARKLDFPALDARLTDVIAGLGWPAGVVERPAAVPVAPCPTSLTYAKSAKLRKPTIETALTAALIAPVRADMGDKEKGAPITFCRESKSGLDYGVYRQPESMDSYTMALGDAGRVLNLYPALALKGGKPGFTMTLDNLGVTMIYPPFDKLPAPEVAWKTIKTAKPMSSASREGKKQNITLRDFK
jgi:hypothetical protein